MKMIERPHWRVRNDAEIGPVLWVFDSQDEMVEGFQPCFEDGGSWADLVNFVEEW